MSVRYRGPARSLLRMGVFLPALDMARSSRAAKLVPRLLSIFAILPGAIGGSGPAGAVAPGRQAMAPISQTAKAGARPADAIALMFQGKPVSVRDLTTVCYRRGLSFCERACRLQMPEVGRAPISFLLRPPSPWPQRPRQAGRRFYLAMLQHVVDDFLEYQVVRQMERQYHLDAQGYIDRRALAAVSKIQARYDSAAYRFLLHAAAHDRSFGRFYADLRGHFPVMIYGPKRSTRDFWHRLRASKAYLYALVHSFPSWEPKTGRPSPWSRYWTYRGITQVDLALIYKRNPAKYIAINDVRFGQWHMEIIKNAGRSAAIKNGLLRLVSAAGDRSGHVAFGELALANQVLATIGSPTTVGVAVGNSFVIRNMYGVKFLDLRSRQLIQTASRTGTDVRYLFLLQCPPPRATDSTKWAPGSDLYGTYYEAILLPIARHVLREASAVMEGLKLPSPQALTDRVFVNPGYLDGGSALGTKLPKVRLKVPWPPLR